VAIKGLDSREVAAGHCRRFFNNFDTRGGRIGRKISQGNPKKRTPSCKILANVASLERGKKNDEFPGKIEKEDRRSVPHPTSEVTMQI